MFLLHLIKRKNKKHKIVKFFSKKYLKYTMNTKTEKNQLIVAYFYVSKTIQKEPAKAIRFILENRHYFKNISDYDIDLLKKERFLTDDDIDNVDIRDFKNY